MLLSDFDTTVSFLITELQVLSRAHLADRERVLSRHRLDDAKYRRPLQHPSNLRELEDLRTQHNSQLESLHLEVKHTVTEGQSCNKDLMSEVRKQLASVSGTIIDTCAQR